MFRLPDVGEGLTEAEIVAWHVQVGDTISVNDILVDVETAKSVVELPSPFAGVVLELNAKEGATLAVGAPLITVGEATELPAVPQTATPSANAEPKPQGQFEPKPLAEPTPAAHVSSVSEAPLILVGTGPREAGGRRVRVRRPEKPAYRRPRMNEPAAPLSIGGEAGSTDAETWIPVQRDHHVTAETTVRSASNAPHLTMWTTVDVTAMMNLVRRLRNDRAWGQGRVSPLLLITKAVVMAVRQYPQINAAWDDGTQETVLRRTLNLGLATPTPKGLLVPNIKDAGSMSLHDLASALDYVTVQARTGRLAPADMSGEALTLTHFGTLGVEGALRTLNPSDGAILAIGTIECRPWVVDGAVAAREVMTLSLSADHRVIDGELSASFLNWTASLLSDPALALL